jgi:hypothetical protein
MAAARSYYQTAESVGEWWGEGAKTLGLEGRPTLEQFDNLLAGKHPLQGWSYEKRKTLRRQSRRVPTAGRDAQSQR